MVAEPPEREAKEVSVPSQPDDEEEESKSGGDLDETLPYQQLTDQDLLTDFQTEDSSEGAKEPDIVTDTELKTEDSSEGG